MEVPAFGSSFQPSLFGAILLLLLFPPGAVLVSACCVVFEPNGDSKGGGDNAVEVDVPPENAKHP